MSNNTKYALITVCILAAVGTAAALLLWTSPGAERPRFATTQRTDLRVAMAPNDSAALLYIAQSQDFFAHAGLNVEFIPCNTDGDALRAVVEGWCDLAVALDFAFSENALRNRDLSVLSVLAQSTLGELVFRSDAAARGKADLRGERIGVPGDPFHRYQLSRYLMHQDAPNIRPSIIHMPTSRILAALNEGALEGAFVAEPLRTTADANVEGGVIAWGRQVTGAHFLCLVAGDEWIDLHSTEARACIEALKLADEFIHTHGDEARRAVARARDLPLMYVNDTWQKHRFEVHLPQTLLPLLEDEARWINSEAGRPQDRIPNFFHAIRPEILHAVEEERVSMVH